jgi:hypothetical protein
MHNIIFHKHLNNLNFGYISMLFIQKIDYTFFKIILNTLFLDLINIKLLLKKLEKKDTYLFINL